MPDDGGEGLGVHSVFQSSSGEGVPKLVGAENTPYVIITTKARRIDHAGERNQPPTTEHLTKTQREPQRLWYNTMAFFIMKGE